MDCYTKRGLLYKTRVGEGCIYAAEKLEGTCGASLGWGAGQRGRRRKSWEDLEHKIFDQSNSEKQ